MTVPLNFKGNALSVALFYLGISRGTQPKRWLHPSPPTQASEFSFIIVTLATRYLRCYKLGSYSVPEAGWLSNHRNPEYLSLIRGWWPLGYSVHKANCPSSPSLVPGTQGVPGEPLVPTAWWKLGNIDSTVRSIMGHANSSSQREGQGAKGIINFFLIGAGTLCWSGPCPHQSKGIGTVL